MKYHVSFRTKTQFLFCESNKLSSYVKRSLLLWLHNKSCLSQQKAIKVKRFGISLLFM